VIGPHADAADSRAGAAIVVMDLAARRIPDIITLPMLVYACLLAVLHQTTTPVQSILGLVIGGWVPLIIADDQPWCGRWRRRQADGCARRGARLAERAVCLRAVARRGGLVVLGLTFISLTLSRDGFPIGSFIALVGAIFVAVGL
jgi:type IV leader peptidase family protein